MNLLQTSCDKANSFLHSEFKTYLVIIFGGVNIEI